MSGDKQISQYNVLLRYGAYLMTISKHMGGKEVRSNSHSSDSESQIGKDR